MFVFFQLIHRMQFPWSRRLQQMHEVSWRLREIWLDSVNNGRGKTVDYVDIVAAINAHMRQYTSYEEH